jgi:hypothetical protein
VQLHYACGVVAIAIPSKTKQQIAIGLSFSFSTKGDRSLGMSQKWRCLRLQMVDRPFQTKRAIVQHNRVKQHFKQREGLKIENYC